MRLLKIRLTNFASYRELEFDFQSQGLTLISGPTGSGKSTLQDGPCWIMYGKTAKGGNSDEVLAWTSEGEPTKGVLTVYTASGIIEITRIRGKPSENDLFWTEAGDSTLHRGKDGTETQSLLSKRLGVDIGLYATACYSSDFSPTSHFFLADAKDRRAVLEKIANLELPARIAAKASEARKAAKKEVSQAELALATATGRLEQLERSVGRAERDAKSFEETRETTLAELRARSRHFEAEKAAKIAAAQLKVDRWDADHSKAVDAAIATAERLAIAPGVDAIISAKIAEIDALILRLSTETCEACGGPFNTAAVADLQEQRLAQLDKRLKRTLAQSKYDAALEKLEALSNESNPHLLALSAAIALTSHYEQIIVKEASCVNPYQVQYERLNAESLEAVRHAAACSTAKDEAAFRVGALTQVYDLSFTLRGEMLRKSVSQVERETNRRLEAYFEAEFRVGFTLSDDSVDVSIQKSGHECVFRQLSKGQRRMLTLCFSAAVMAAAANNSGVSFSQMFFDESVDGMDSALKVKSYALFQELETKAESVFVIEHDPGLQEMFSNRYSVELVGDRSQVTHES